MFQTSVFEGGRSRAAPVSWQAPPPRALPHHDTIQRYFGRHSLADIRIHAGPGPERSLDEVGARAATIGPSVFLGQEAGLRVAAHEAAHVVQQRRGMKVGRAMEEHAESVAGRIVAGRSAEDLLDEVGTDTARPAPQLLAYGGPMDVKSTKAADFRKKAFENARKKVQKLFKEKKIRKKLTEIVGMEITTVDATNALTVPVVFESEVMHGLGFTDTQASGLDKANLKKDREFLWDARAKDAQAFFQTGKGAATLIKQPMIAVLDETEGERYQEKSGFIRNIGNTTFEGRLVHEYVHAAIFHADKRRKKTMYGITDASYKTSWRDQRVADLEKALSSDSDRKELRKKLLRVGALKPKDPMAALSRERAPVFFGSDEEKAAKRAEWEKKQAEAKKLSDLRELVLGLVRFEEGHGLKRTGKYTGKTQKKLDDLAPKYSGGSPSSWMEHAAMTAISVEIASGSDKP